MGFGDREGCGQAMRSAELPFDVDRTEYPFTSRWHEAEGARIHYLDEGSGSPVLLLHGNPTWSYLYRDVVRDLRGEARCVVPDYPGFGGSRAPEDYRFLPREHAARISRLVEHLGLRGAVLVGHDWGGPIGLSVVTEHPERFRAIVLCNTWCWAPDWMLWLFSVVLGGSMGRYLCVHHNFFVRYLMPLGVTRWRYRSAVPAAYRDPLRGPRRRRATWVFPRSIRTEVRWIRSVRERLGALRAPPVDLVVGEDDRVFGRPSVVQRWRKVYPTLSAHRVPGASHYLQEDRPEALTRVVRRRLRTG